VTPQQPRRSVVEELLVSTIYDWIDLGFLRSTVREMTGVGPAELHAAVMTVVSQLVGEGLVAAGDVTDGGFRAWDCSRDQAVSRIDREWRAESDPELWPFQVAALAPTQEGLTVIEAVMAREGGDESWRARLAQSPLAVAHSLDE
jgi:hypothetical protein